MANNKFKKMFNIAKIFCLIFFAVMIISVSKTYAATVSVSDLNKISVASLISSSCNIKTAGDLSVAGCVINLVTNWLLDVAGFVSFIMIVYAAIVYLTSYGDENKVELGKKTLTWSVIGIIIITIGKAILYIIQNYFLNGSIK